MAINILKKKKKKAIGETDASIYIHIKMIHICNFLVNYIGTRMKVDIVIEIVAL